MKTRPCLHIDKATKILGETNETNFKPKLSTASVECNGTVTKLPIVEKAIPFLNLNSRLIHGGDLVFWFTFNPAVHFRTKIALTLEIVSD